MFGKSWKRIALSLGVLFLIVISGLCYLSFDSRRKSKEPVKIYRVTEPVKKDTSSDTTKNDTHSNSNYQKGPETAETHPSTKSVSTPSVDPNTTSGESAQQGSDLKTAQQNDEVSSKEETEQKKEEIQAEIRRLEDSMRETQNSLAHIIKKHNTFKKNYEQKYYELADKLNSLSVEEQQAHFEDFRNQLPAAKEFIRSTLFENARTEAVSQEYSEQMEKIISQIVQTIQEIPDEQGVKQYIEKLREYGFKPKF